MATLKLPLVYDAGTNTHRELKSGSEVLDTKASVQISTDAKNAMTNGTDGGLYVEDLDPAAIITADSDNVLTTGIDGKLKVASVKPVDLISADAGNIVKTGSDSKLFTSPHPVPADFVSATAGNEITLGIDDKLVMKMQVSSDTGNITTLGSDGRPFTPAPPELPVPADFISATAGNELVLGVDNKLMVPVTPASAYISSQTPNVLTTGSDAKLLVPPVQPATLVSDNTGNALTVGTDSKLMVNQLRPTQAISTDAGNRLTTGTSDPRLYVGPERPQDLISNDARNRLTTGTSDPRLFVGPDNPINHISRDPANNLRAGTDNLLFVPTPKATDYISAESGNRIIRAGLDHLLYVGKEPAANYVSDAAGNSLSVSTSDQNLFVHVPTGAEMVSGNAANNLTTGTDGKLFVNVMQGITVDPADKILTCSTNGVRGEVTLTMDSATRTVSLVGKNSQTISSFVLPEASFIQGVAVVTDPAGQPAGTYLAITFTTESGTETVYVDAAAMMQTYVAGNAGIEVDGLDIKLVVDPNSALHLSADGVSLDQSMLLSGDAENRLTVGTDDKLYVPKLSVTDMKDGGGIGVDDDSKLFVNLGELVSDADGNIITAESTDGKLFAELPAVSSYISADADNQLELGSDGNLLVNVPAVSPAALITEDTPNQLDTGSDGKLRVLIVEADAATATADGTIRGLVGLAADNNTTARNMAATPAGVAAQITAVGIMNPTPNTIPLRTGSGGLYAVGVTSGPSSEGGVQIDYRGAFPDVTRMQVLNLPASGSTVTAPGYGFLTFSGHVIGIPAANTQGKISLNVTAMLNGAMRSIYGVTDASIIGNGAERSVTLAVSPGMVVLVQYSADFVGVGETGTNLIFIPAIGVH